MSLPTFNALNTAYVQSGALSFQINARYLALSVDSVNWRRPIRYDS